MRISSFHIDGFGALSDVGYDNLAPGLVVALGPNEAGKSTLFDFLAGVLFGFPARRADPRFRPPSRGGRHGGRVGFVDDADGSWAVERYTGPGKMLRVRTPDGLLGDDNSLKRALAGASAGLFRAVFAVGLDELGGMESLGDDEVRELLFTASLIGQRSSATIAMRNLGDQCSGLARPRRGDAVANRLAVTLEETRGELVAARHQAGTYHALQREAIELKTDADAARSELRQARDRDRDLHLLIKAWAVQSRTHGLRRDVAGLPDPSNDKPLLDRVAEIGALKAAQSGHQERVARLAGVSHERSRQLAEVATSLGRLGAGWTIERARTSVDPGVLADHVRTCRQELTRLATDAASGDALLRNADETLAVAAGQAQALSAQFAGGSKPPKRALIDRSLDLVDELHDRFGELERLENEVAVDQQDHMLAASEATDRPASPLPAISLLVAALAVGCICALAAAGGDWLLAIVAAVVALGLAVAGGVAFRQQRKIGQPGRVEPTAPDEAALPSKAAVLARERARVHELADDLALPLPPSRVDIERCAAGLQRSLTARRQLDSSADAVAQAAKKAEAARDTHDRCLRDIELRRQDFARWRLAHGLGSFSEPDEALEAISIIGDVRGRLPEISRLERVLDSTNDEVAEFVAEVERICTSVGLGSPGVGSADSATAPADTQLTDGRIAQLSEALAGAQERTHHRRQLENDLAGSADALRDLLGQGPRAEALEVELGSGQLLSWERELDDLGRAVERLEAAEELAVRRHQSVSETMEELASSDRIAVLEQREAELEAELDATLRQYLVLGTARSLLQRTLAHHEKERQPAVIASAAAHFRRVTAGRYVNLIADADAEGRQTIRVVSSGGAEIDAACLSRGTIEQLYLCLRLGLADSFAERAVGLPMVLDDVLVNFDPERAESMAAELALTARNRQVLLMTCHPALAELALRTADESAAESQLIELQRIA